MFVVQVKGSMLSLGIVYIVFVMKPHVYICQICTDTGSCASRMAQECERGVCVAAQEEGHRDL